jgi:NAD(P)-dependent dehydrogenase (short-subunit alcohol dehydrogenase family)
MEYNISVYIYLFFSEAFKRTKEEFGGIDIVVNNAGIGGESDDKWESVIDVNMVLIIFSLNIWSAKVYTKSNNKY